MLAVMSLTDWWIGLGRVIAPCVAEPSEAEKRCCLKSGTMERSDSRRRRLDLMCRARAIAAKRIPTKQRTEMAKRICMSPEMRIARVLD